jgi:hypothetical protein
MMEGCYTHPFTFLPPFASIQRPKTLLLYYTSLR